MRRHGLVLLLFVGCSTSERTDSLDPRSPAEDAGLTATLDAGVVDAEVVDAELTDAELTDAVGVDVRVPRWSRVTEWTGSAGPPELLQPNLWVDPTAPDDLIVFGGLGPDFSFQHELWSLGFARGRWDPAGSVRGELSIRGGRVAPGPRPETVVVLDEHARRATSPRQVLTQIEYGGETPSVTVLETAAPTDGWYGGAFFYAETLDRYVVACGSTASGASQCEVVLYDPRTRRWEVPEVEGVAPQGRFGFAHVWDAASQRLVIFSGARSIVGGAYVSDSETWALELGERPLRWVRLDLAGAPSPRVYGCHALDAEGHRMITFGGALDMTSFTDEVWALDLRLGSERWERLDVPAAPPARALCSAVADPDRGRVLVGFGNGPSGFYADLWGLEL